MEKPSNIKTMDNILSVTSKIIKDQAMDIILITNINIKDSFIMINQMGTDKFTG